jgi:biopolymer transport protein TolR
MRRRRHRKEEAHPADGELNIVPLLDIVMNVVMFLLATTTAAFAVAQVDIETPGRCVGCDAPPGLNIGVALGSDAIIVDYDSGTLAEECPRIPHRDGRYDFAALEACLERVHAQFPREDSVILTADPEVPYEHVIGAMDAARGSFPRVMLSAGVR